MFRGQTEPGNDRPIWGVNTSAVEDDLVRANQTGLAGDNLVSVIGAEEDGVDNRVEVPTWSADGGSDGATADQKTDDAQSPSADSADGTPKPEAAEPRADQPKAPKSGGMSAGTPDKAAPWRAPSGGLNPAAAPPLPAESLQHGPAYTTPAGQPGPTQTSTFPAAVGAAADAARGLASKVSSPFSGLTKPRPKPQTKKPVGSGSGHPPRSQPWPPQTRLSTPPQNGLQPRSAQLRLHRLEPWSVMKFSFLISIVGWVILVVAVSILYFALSKFGVFASIEHTVGLVTSTKSNPAGSNASSWFRASRVIGYTMLIGAINIVLITALATIGAVLYNLVTIVTGGIEVTLKESD
jgi:hypothetical protein